MPLPRLTAKSQARAVFSVLDRPPTIIGCPSTITPRTRNRGRRSRASSSAPVNRRVKAGGSLRSCRSPPAGRRHRCRHASSVGRCCPIVQPQQFRRRLDGRSAVAAVLQGAKHIKRPPPIAVAQGIVAAMVEDFAHLCTRQTGSCRRAASTAGRCECSRRPLSFPRLTPAAL